ncbi:MAG: deoxycytidylate deaminase [Planctomycetota bacterium]|jgi:dCMP deaminase
MDRADKDFRRDSHLLRISKMFAEFSTCLSRKVGCLIASDAGHVISTGYNGAPKKTRHSCEAGCFCQDPTRKSGTYQERLRCSHAELNAIAQAAFEGVSTRDARIYCVTFPCSFCCKAIIQAGIRKVIYEEEYNDALSKMLFEEAGIECLRIAPQPETEPLPTFEGISEARKESHQS